MSVKYNLVGTKIALVRKGGKRMKIVLIMIDLLLAGGLFFSGRYFMKAKNPERSILFLSGDFSGLDLQKVCRVTGRRFVIWAILFLLGSVADFIRPGVGIAMAFCVWIVLLVLHLIDMTVNRSRKYRI